MYVLSRCHTHVLSIKIIPCRWRQEVVSKHPYIYIYIYYRLRGVTLHNTSVVHIVLTFVHDNSTYNINLLISPQCTVRVSGDRLLSNVVCVFLVVQRIVLINCLQCGFAERDSCPGRILPTHCAMTTLQKCKSSAIVEELVVKPGAWRLIKCSRCLHASTPHNSGLDITSD
jgi:hypothetical protein